jgi:hypothetical protein
MKTSKGILCLLLASSLAQAQGPTKPPPSTAVNAQTASYTLTGTDNNKLVTMNCASCTATLPPSQGPSWAVWIENLNSTALTIARGTAQINGGTSSITLNQYQFIRVFTDGTNYFTAPALLQGSGVTLSPASNGITISSTGGVSSITQGTGMSFSVSPITSTGTINLATPVAVANLPTLPTYAAVGNDMVASGASAAHGLAPAPSTTAGTTKFLREDATWSVPAGGGNVSNVGTPVNLQMAQWTGATTIQGVATTGTGNAVLATSPTITTPTIAALPNLTSNGFVKTSGGVGTLSIDTSTYLTGNQTITLTGPVTGSGTTSIATTIGSAQVTNANLVNSSITLNAGTSTGETVPGAMSLGSTYTIGATTDKRQMGSIGLNIAAPATVGLFSEVLGANATTGIQLKRFTDTSPTGNFIDADNAAGSSVFTIDITGNMTVGTVPAARLTGTLAAGQFPALTGDTTTTAGSLATTTGKVNGVAYGTSPATNTVPVITGSNTATYEAVPNAALANSTMTLAGTSTALGGTLTLDQITGLSAVGMVKRSGANALVIATAKTDYWDTTLVAEGGTHNAGLVPDPGATLGTTKFLREDGTWVAPPGGAGVPAGGTANQVLAKIDATNYNTQWVTPSGGGGAPGGSNTQVQYNNSGSFGGIVGATTNGTILTLAASDFNLTDGLFTNEAAPATPSAGATKVYVDSTSKNIAAKNDAGTVNHGVQTQASVTHKFLSAIADAGTVSTAQAASTDLSDFSTTAPSADGQIPIWVAASSSYVPGDPKVQGLQADGSTTAVNPEVIGGYDTAATPALHRAIELNAAPAGTEYGLVTRNIPSGTQAVSGTFWQATQPVSGTVTANAGSGTFTIGGTVTANIGTTNGLALDTSVQGLLVAQGTALGSTKGQLEFGSVTTAAPTYTTGQVNAFSLNTSGGLRVDGSGVTQPVSGTFWQATQPVSGTVTANAGTGTFTVGGTVTANIGTSGSLALDTSVNGVIQSQASTTSGEKGPLIQGAVTTAAPSYTTAQTNPLSLTTAGALRTDASATTQPVSGTFWQATQPVSGTVTANIGSAGTLALDSSVNAISLAQGSTTSGQKGVLQLGAVTTAAPTYTTAQTSPISLTTAGAVRTDASATTQPVSGTVTANPGNVANTTPWLVKANEAPTTSGGATIYRLLSAATTNSNNIKASAGQLYGWYLFNTSASIKYVKLYNKATAPTVGTDVPVLTFPLPPTDGAVQNPSGVGIAFATGIGIAITGGAADADTTAVAANDVIINLFYQ